MIVAVGKTVNNIITLKNTLLEHYNEVDFTSLNEIGSKIKGCSICKEDNGLGKGESNSR